MTKKQSMTEKVLQELRNDIINWNYEENDMITEAEVSQKFGVKSGAKSNCLRENCGLSGAGNSVERFIPPVVGGDAKPLDCRCVIA